MVSSKSVDVNKTTENVLDKVSTSSTGNIKMKQYLCVRQSIPRSRLTRTILNDNVTEDRHLLAKLSTLTSRRERIGLYLDINRRAFENSQFQKQEKWKREDEEALASWNMPSLKPPNGTIQVNPRTVTMYTVPEYRTKRGHSTARKPVLPMLKIKRERTEIVSQGDRTFVTQLPRIVEVDNAKLHHYNAYTGKSMTKSWPTDQRFRELHSKLQPVILKKWDAYPFENVMSQSRTAKFSENLLASAHRRRLSQHHDRVVVASRSNLSRERALHICLKIKNHIP